MQISVQREVKLEQMLWSPRHGSKKSMQKDRHSLQSLLTCAAAWTSIVSVVAGVTF